MVKNEDYDDQETKIIYFFGKQYSSYNSYFTISFNKIIFLFLIFLLQHYIIQK